MPPAGEVASTAGAAPDAAGSLLERIVASKKKEIALLSEPFAKRQTPVRSLGKALAASAASGPRIIAECKKASPSKGLLRADYRPADIAEEYQRCGAAAISVLTDGPFFQGSAADLQAVRERVSIPVLRKDFTLEAVQIREAHAMGADAILLIVRLLPLEQLKLLLAEAQRLGLEALVETHNAEEVEIALKAGADIIGINHRDLDTLKMDLSLTEKLAPRIRKVRPAARIIAESGVEEKAGRQMVAPFADALLVGTAFMQSQDIAKTWQQVFSDS